MFSFLTGGKVEDAVVVSFSSPLKYLLLMCQLGAALFRVCGISSPYSVLPVGCL